jgi:hypothetical protein
VQEEHGGTAAFACLAVMDEKAVDAVDEAGDQAAAAPRPAARLRSLNFGPRA